MIKSVFSLLMCLIFSTALSTQNEVCNELRLQERRELASHWMEELAGSGLVVVMESNRRQISYLESQLQAKSGHSEKRSNKFREEIASLKEKAHDKAVETIEAFQENYDFSQVFFIWDYDMRYVLQQPDTTVYLSAELDYFEDSPFQLSDEVYFLIRGRADRSSGRSGMQGFLIRNRELNPLCTPFPYFLARNDNSFINVIFSIFKPDLYGEREMKQVAERFNMRFKDFMMR